MPTRTRIKICGLTRPEDVKAAVAAGADALGFVFYPQSPRYVTPAAAAELMSLVPPFVTTVGLFVNATPAEVASVLRVAPVSTLQFHGDESMELCSVTADAVHLRFLRAIRIRSDTKSADLLKYAQQYRAASGRFSALLLDTFVDGYGGGGKVFDWSLIPKELAPQVVLSGGLSVQNVTDAVLRVRPWAVDISSGVELQKGIKDAGKIHSFVEAVRLADTAIDGGHAHP